MSSDSQALNLFEQFLERHHEAGASIDALCKEHPRHADRFRRWWNQLLDSGEVSEATIPNAGANQDSETAEDGSRFGAYKILRELGRGSQATVFLAEDTRLNRRVALKVLSSWRSLTGESARRFAREAELASRLDHPGLCTVYERGTSGENAFLAMRLVHGKSLSAMIGQAKRREEAEGHSGALRLRDAQAESETGAIHTMLRLFEEIALALHAAHEAGLIHRDVKPGNIMVDERGKPVLLDFGLAREVESDEPVLTLSGDLVGTPAYMSPEQLAAHRIELDRRTDVYSLAATLFECLTLRRPFEAPTRNELYQAILTAEPARPRQFNAAISRELEVVLWTALDRDRRRRYQTAADLAEDLRRVRCREPIRARPAGPLLRCKRWGQRNPAVAASLIVLLFSLSVGLAVSVWFHGQAQTARQGFERLVDRGRVRVAMEEARQLLPVQADRLADLQRWIDRHAPLADRLREHSAYLQQLRARALPWSEADRQLDRVTHPDHDELESLRRDTPAWRYCMTLANRGYMRDVGSYNVERAEARIQVLEKAVGQRRTWRFRRADEQSAHDAVALLVEELSRFAGPSGWLSRLQRELQVAQDFAARKSGPDSEAWAEAKRIAREDRRYGFELSEQFGLVPLRRCPQSGYLEFAHLRSGKIPVRDKDGRLQLDGDSAIVLVLLPGGPFQMGTPTDNKTVELGPFFMAKCELTRGQWRRLTGESAPRSPLVIADGPEFPVESVSWVAATKRLAQHGLQLPTEAQWEYAARGGSRRRWWWGNGTPERERSVGNVRDATFAKAMGVTGGRFYDDQHVVQAPAGFSLPNPFGLHDTVGNVAEWCREPFLPVALTWFDVEGKDGLHQMPAGDRRSVRGGSFESLIRDTGVFKRGGRREDVGHRGIGVRPVRMLVK